MMQPGKIYAFNFKDGGPTFPLVIVNSRVWSDGNEVLTGVVFDDKRERPLGLVFGVGHLCQWIRVDCMNDFCDMLNETYETAAKLLSGQLVAVEVPAQPNAWIGREADCLKVPTDEP